MITKIISIRLIFSCLLALFPYFLFSTQLILTPDNLQEVLAELSNRHEEEITISMAEVKLFLKENISGSFDAKLLSPDPEIIEIDDEQIAFAWAEIAHANSYITRYLNLDNGDFGDLSTEDPAAHFTLENHLFLFAFQAISPEGKGSITIIIQDKPLTIGNGILSNDCFCEEPISIEYFNVLTIPQRLVQYPYAANINETYTIQVSFMGVNGNMINTSFSVRLVGANSQVTNVFLTADGICSPNVRYDPNNIYVVDPGLMEADSDDIDAIIFSFVGPGAGFKSLSPIFLGDLTLTKCANDLIAERKDTTVPYSELSAKVIPNPSSGIILFSWEQDAEQQPIRLSLRNVMGRTLQEFCPEEASNQLIDLSTYSNGTYYLHAISEKASKVYPIVKQE